MAEISQMDRILGVVFGHALGDAVGLTTRGKSKTDIHEVTFPYTESIKSFPVGDWTENTDTMILIMQSMVANNLKLIPQDIAERIKTWAREGFAELGDVKGLEYSKLVMALINEPNFEKDPYKTSYDFWEKSKRAFATSSSLARGSIVGVLPTEMAVNWAMHLSQVTNCDPRCVSSCVLQAELIHALVYSTVSTPEHIDELLKTCVEHCLNVTVDSVELSQYTQAAYTGRIEDIHLDDSRATFVLKSMSCIIYALQVIKVALRHKKTPNFKKFITKIVSEGGEAHCNAAVAGAIMGAYLGCSRLPDDWMRAMPNATWLTTQLEPLTQLTIPLTTPVNCSTLIDLQ